MKIWTNKSLISFISTVTILSLIVEVLIIKYDIQILYLLLMWVPTISATIANIISINEKREKLSIKQYINRLGIRDCKTYYIILGILIPLVYLLIPYMIYWKIYPDNFAYHGVAIIVVLSDITLPMIVGIFMGILSAIGEEIGWRGYMLPSLLERVDLKKALLITSLFWACWHLPILIFGDYMSGASLWYKIPAFIMCVVPVGIICGILTIKSNSIWPATFLHAAHNHFDQGIFGLITRGDKMMYYVSETGFLTIICAWIIAIMMLIYYLKKEK